MSMVLLLIPALPALLALGALSGHLGGRGVPASVTLTAALAGGFAIVGADPVHLDWLLLGTTLGLGSTAQALLGAAAILWTAAAIAARRLFDGDTGPRFGMCFLLTFAGNLGVIVVQDLAGFYLAFAVMTFAAYGLVVHDESREAVRAGRIYLILSIAGEALLLGGIFMLAAEVGNPAASAIPAAYEELTQPQVVGGLLLAGFAVKMGIAPLHVWLPLAHPAAPVPASAVLSGIIVKGGLLGWLQFVPAGDPALALPGNALTALGLVSAFGAALIGCFQSRAKTVLAYSTISQMGLLAVPVGLLVAGHGDAGLLLPAITLFALHHALNKGALFLAMDQIKHGRRAVALITALPAIALVGVPVASGLIAKGAVKSALPEPFALALTLTAITTALLLIRFLCLIWPGRNASPRALEPVPFLIWLVVVLLGQALPWLYANADDRAYALAPGTLWDGLWPVAIAVVVAGLASEVLKRWPSLPEGDVVSPVERGLRRLYRGVVRRHRQLGDRLRPNRERLAALPAHRLPQHIPEPGIPWVGALILVMTLVLALLYGIPVGVLS
ncbi:complex I subunit 5 family protein [Aquisalimonas asiatica]|uniref:Formate hydrogenlyase subunit 3/Multisubunit Na+/H+ antiporter, MnhD subunit n=1 Tax=Aquisalimonas asiatica TaxID=406100 RepID=A0A1H8PT21_9GAMM|nr:complex I subunit 5 family protein [Aquisalimonas asiatica]SEO45100.1 Formate hydrogenlyase subunit 3/Multisubunit Na+/H+ antiporter, MnhD subunit [Aquisalimonas asiatica]